MKKQPNEKPVEKLDIILKELEVIKKMIAEKPFYQFQPQMPNMVGLYQCSFCRVWCYPNTTHTCSYHITYSA